MAIAVEQVLARLEAVKRSGTGWMARCPAHEDQTPSLSIGTGNDGQILLRCQAGCETSAVLAALDLTMADLRPGVPATGAAQKPVVAATYGYVDERRALLFEVLRYEPKAFRQRRPDGSGGYIWNLKGVRRVPYRLPQVLEAASSGGRIYTVEGEKDVEALERLGLVATCNPGGASKWCEEYSKTLVGAKLVVILPDNDEAGREHADMVAASLGRHGVPHVTAELPGVPTKGDVSDWVTAGGTEVALEGLVKQAMAEPRATDGPADDKPKDLLVWATDVVSRETDWLWERRIPRGTVTIGFGEPGGGKTHVALDIVTRVSRGSAWPDRGRAPMGNCLILSGEDDWATTLKPRLEYAEANLEHVAFFPAVEAFDEKGRRTFSLTVDAATLEHNVKRAGAAFVMVDPLTCFMNGIDIHRQNEVRVALAILADVAERTGAAVFCILHPNKTDKQGISALNRLSGSGAFGAAARSVMAVVKDPQDEAEERRLLLPVKLNIAREPEGHGFRIVSSDPNTCWSGIVWDADPVETDADEAFGVVRADTPQMVKAKAFLKRVLTGGEPYPATVAEEEAEREGIALKTLKRAKKKLHIESRFEGFGADGKWIWRLPTVDPEGDR